MTPVWVALLSGTVGLGVPLILAVWELVRIRRSRGNWGGGGGLPRPRPGGGVPAARPLPACLVPVLPPRSPARVRELA